MALNPDGDITYSTPLPVGKSSLESGLFKQNSMTKAVIIAAGNGSRLQGYQNACPKPLVEVGGIPLLQRVILSAKKIGITEFVIVIGYQAARIRKTINSKKLGVKITWVRNLDWRRPNGISVLKAEKFVFGKFLLLMSDHIFNPKLLKHIEDLDLEKDAGLLCVDYALNRVQNLDDATKVRTENNRLLNLGKSLTDFNAIDIGIFICTPDIFDALRQSQSNGDESLSGGIRVLSRDGRMQTFDIGDTFWQDVDTIPDAHNAERLLFQSTRSPGDGVIARNINRKISNFITKGLIKLPITPNQISISNLVFSLFIAWLVSLGTPATTIIGGILFQLASILDGCDGEVALIKLKNSKRGAFIDTVTDHISYMAFVIGVTIGAFNASGDPMVFGWTGMNIIGLIFALNLGRIYIKKKGSASLRDLDSGIAALNHSGQKVWYLRFFGLIHHFGRRDLFSFTAMLIMLTGNITLLYWVLISFLVMVNVGIPITVGSMLSKNSNSSILSSIKGLWHRLMNGFAGSKMELQPENEISD